MKTKSFQEDSIFKIEHYIAKMIENKEITTIISLSISSTRVAYSVIHYAILIYS